MLAGAHDQSDTQSLRFHAAFGNGGHIGCSRAIETGTSAGGLGAEGQTRRVVVIEVGEVSGEAEELPHRQSVSLSAP